mgnify:CR=1 FL=1
MTRLEALAATSKRFTNSIDGKVISRTSVIGIITYYEYLLDTNPIEVKYQSGIINPQKQQNGTATKELQIDLRKYRCIP